MVWFWGVFFFSGILGWFETFGWEFWMLFFGLLVIFPMFLGGVPVCCRSSFALAIVVCISSFFSEFDD